LNCHYTIEDTALGAFSVFFTQSPSFLAYQKSMQETKGQNNAHEVSAQKIGVERGGLQRGSQVELFSALVNDAG
jgi:hypothetical protein